MQSINHKSIFLRKLPILFFSAFLIVGIFLVKEKAYGATPNWGTEVTTGISITSAGVFTYPDYPIGFTYRGFVLGATSCTTDSGCTGFGGAGGDSATINIESSFSGATDGNYYFGWRGNNSGIGATLWTDLGDNFKVSSWVVMNRTAGVWTLTNIIPPDYSTRIDTFTYATSTGIANVTGYWNTHASSTERLSFWQSSAMLGQESYEEIFATTTGNFNFSFDFRGVPTPYSGSTTTAPFISPYTLHAEISQVYSDFNPFTGEGTPPYLLDATSTVISTLTYGLPDYTTGIGLQEYPEYECAITSITGCLKNAGIWLFYPSSDSVERFKSLSDSLSGKFPFAYVYGMNTMRMELFESAQTATTTISLNFKIIPGHATSSLTLLSSSLLSNVPYANTVKTVVGFILWLMAAEYVYYRVLRSHDPNTPQ